MTRRATDRFLVACLVVVAGALTALLGGVPEAAVLITPWALLLLFGLSRSDVEQVAVVLEATEDRVVVGDDLEVIATITGAAGEIDVACRPGDRFGGGGSIGGARTAGVATDGRAVIRCRLAAPGWGTYDVGRVQLDMTHPYGLLRDRLSVHQPIPIRVHPDPVDLESLLKPWLVRRVTGVHDSKAVARGIEYADTRPFASGDALRDINWRASARSGELWVSQRHPDRATDVILLVDSFLDTGIDTRRVVGLAVEAAVALAESHLAVTDRVGVIELGGVVRWVAPGSGRLQLQRLVDALLATRLFPNAAERDLAVIAPQALPPRSFVVALSPLLDDRFVDALHTLAQHGHDVAVIECREPDVDDRVDATGVGAIARRMWEAERQIVRDDLTSSGIAVTQWSRGMHLDQVLAVLGRRRSRVARAGRR